MAKNVTRVVMARTVAQRWVRRVAHAEYRMHIYYGAREFKNLPNLLRAFRDAKVKIASIDPIPDLGVREDFDAVEVWSSDRAAINTLQKWAEARGFDTSGVW